MSCETGLCAAPSLQRMCGAFTLACVAQCGSVCARRLPFGMRTHTHTHTHTHAMHHVGQTPCALRTHKDARAHFLSLALTAQNAFHGSRVEACFSSSTVGHSHTTFPPLPPYGARTQTSTPCSLCPLVPSPCARVRARTREDEHGLAPATPTRPAAPHHEAHEQSQGTFPTGVRAGSAVEPPKRVKMHQEAASSPRLAAAGVAGHPSSTSSSSSQPDTFNEQLLIKERKQAWAQAQVSNELLDQSSWSLVTSLVNVLSATKNPFLKTKPDRVLPQAMGAAGAEALGFKSVGDLASHIERTGLRSQQPELPLL